MTKRKKRVLALMQRTGRSGEWCAEVLRTRTPEDVERLAREAEQERWAAQGGFPVTAIDAADLTAGVVVITS